VVDKKYLNVPGLIATVTLGMNTVQLSRFEKELAKNIPVVIINAANEARKTKDEKINPCKP